MARYQKQRIDYPMGSVSCGTMRNEDLIPTFCYELENLAKSKNSGVPAKVRKQHLQIVRDIETAMEHDDNNAEREPYFDSEDADYDLNETLFDALNEYAAPYFYFGSHLGDGADYGFWLSEGWDENFISASEWENCKRKDPAYEAWEGIKVDDSSEIPMKYRGEVAVVNDHGNVTLYVKTSRALREVWAIV